MSAPELMVRIGEETVPLLDCAWVQIAPCGCMCGATVTGIRDPRYGSDVKATVEDAWRAMYEGMQPEVRRRDEKAGFRFELVTWETYRGMDLKCVHDPKWGVEPDPQPDGMVWAVHRGRSWNGPHRSSRLHLVAAEKVDREFADRFDADRRPLITSALCKQRSNEWLGQPHHTSGRAKCSNCVNEAKAVAQ